ncbi:MAG TPA: hypothetical protein ENJ45_00960 [Phaeodactylibacter sp.]|nr:hypothetical protein [Phaeodactylibacter sp.]
MRTVHNLFVLSNLIKKNSATESSTPFKRTLDAAVPICEFIFYTVFIFLFTFAHELSAQEAPTGQIIGVARDATTGEPLVGVHIIIESLQRITISGEAGTFELANMPVGKYDLKASYLGYLDLLLTKVHITDSKKTMVAFEMQPQEHIMQAATVTATRKAQAARLAPASIGLVSRIELQRKNISTFDQAFDGIAGVTLTRTSGANVQAFSIRGASEVAGGGIGNRVLLLIDGRPALSPESGGALWNLVPLGSIERIEVVKGPYSSLYGSSAMGGVVNVITKKPSQMPSTHLQMRYGFYENTNKNADYSGYHDFYQLALNHSRSIGRFSYLIDAAYQHNDGHREKSFYRLLNFYSKAAYLFNGNRQLHLSVNANNIYNDTPATWLSHLQPYKVADFKKDDYQNRSEWNLDLHYYAIPNAKLKYSTRLYYYQNHSSYTFDSDPHNDSTNINIGKQILDASSIRAQRWGNISQVDLYRNDKHSIVLGTDIKYDKTIGLPDNVLYGKHNALHLGIYFQDEVQLSQKLTATAGLRYDHYYILGEYEEGNFSPKLACVFQLNKHLSFRTLWAHAFRNPSIAERFIKYEQGGGLRFQVSPNLKSERLDNSFELGAKTSIRKRVTLDLALFYNHYKNLISFQQVSQPLEPLVYEVMNLKKAVLQGFEITYRHQWWKKHLSTSLAYTFLDARDVSDDRYNDYLAYKSKHTFNASLWASYKSFALSFQARYRSAIREVFIYPGSEPDAAWRIDAKLSYRFSKERKLSFSIDNITDTAYEELERYRMPGRSYTLSATYRF